MDQSSTALPTSNSTFLELPDYLPYLELGLNWTALITHGITAICMGFLILAMHCQSQLLRVQQLAYSLILFFYAHFIFSVLCMPYQVYRVWRWQAPGTYTHNTFSPLALYWLSLPEMVYYGAIPSVVFLLAIERFVGLKWPLSFIKRHFSLFTATMFGIVLLLNTVGHLLELPLDMSLVMICETASCTTTTYRLYFQIVSKITFSCANVACSILLLVMLNGIDKAMKLVLALPIGAPNSGLKGEIAITCCAFDGAMCGILYMVILLKRKQSTVANATTVVPFKNMQKIPENAPTNLLALPTVS
ncbi:hypothetical protein GPALN_013122 [Globodera pallida]|nr:hypothetical protein GPALN_013122 [Globodera pallida]